MAVTATPICPQAINVGVITIVTADAQAQKVAFTAGANGSKIEAMNLSSTDTVARDVSVYLTRTAVNYLLTTVSVPAGAGAPGAPAAIPSVDVLQNLQIPSLAFDAYGNNVLYLKSGDTLTINAPVSVTAAKTITSMVQGGDF